MRNGALTVGELIERLQEEHEYAPVYLRQPDEWNDAMGAIPATFVRRGLMEVVIG